jgi:hypothetical protein
MNLDDVFGKSPKRINAEDCTCHSGGAEGADTAFEVAAARWGITTKAYSYKTKYHESLNKVEISQADYEEGVEQVNKANRRLGRFGISRYMNLLARNWSQVKYSRQVFAVGTIVDPGKKDSKGYKNKWKQQIVSGGTGYAVMMAVLSERDVYVFDQNIGKWHRWSYLSEKFQQVEPPLITENQFAGIGTRQLSESGRAAIDSLFEKTFS